MDSIITPQCTQSASWRTLGLFLLVGLAALPVGANASQETDEDSATGTLFQPLDTQRPEDVAKELSHKDPTLAGWDSEVQQGGAKAALKAFLGSVFEHGSRQLADFGELFSNSFAGSTVLRPGGMDKTYDDGATRTHRADSISSERFAGDQLGRLLTELCAPYEASSHPHAILKIITSDSLPNGGLKTEALIQIDGQSGSGRLQQNFNWLVTWSVTEGEQLQIRDIELLEFTEAYTPKNIYSEVTETLFGSLPFYEEHVLHGVDDYANRYDVLGGTAFLGSQGVTVADINNDGYQDIYICQEGGVSNRLLLHNPDGTVIDVSMQTGAGILDATRSALVLDIDADGDQDLVLAIGSNVLILYNDGELRFTENQWLVDELPSDVFSMAAADPDNDGDLDIYACRHNSMGSLGANPVPLYDANNGAPNLFWRNEGNREFTQATKEVGLDTNNTKFSFAAVWEDFDADGDLDLFVANDYGRNNLYRNEDGHFKDVGTEVGIAESAASMGISCADYDLDGDIDLLVSNMFSAAGQRTVSHTEKFMEKQRIETQADFARTARGNTLFSNNGKGVFGDETDVAGIAMGRWSWGSRFIDFNNDGLEDMYVPNGFVTNTNSDDL
ncbi:MAG: hypothetical protein ACI9F9_002159 [Candidatus Paceibacteria bacterium]|jgi:hypothetical protein